MSRILGIDFGLKRIGLAVTDPLKMFAQPLETIQATTFPDWLKKYCLTENLESIVVGMPVNLTGEDTDATQYVKQFIEWINTNYPQIPVHTIDERFSSHDAQQQLHTMGLKKNQRREKGILDTVSATLILQTYLQKIA
jgi:putative Holliday junction resolvase